MLILRDDMKHGTNSRVCISKLIPEDEQEVLSNIAPSRRKLNIERRHTITQCLAVTVKEECLLTGHRRYSGAGVPSYPQ